MKELVMADEKEPLDDKNAALDAEGNPEGGEEGGEGKKKKRPSKKIILIALLVVLLLAAGAGAYVFLGMNKHEDVEGASSKEQVVYYTMPQMIINLSSPGKQASFLKATVILELQNALDAVTVEANLPRLMDALNTYVRELRPSDLSGTAGITRLREELLLRANKALEPMKINNILFKEIVVQ
jgi:flagellar FliL protein